MPCGKQRMVRRWTRSARGDGRVSADLLQLEEAVCHERVGDPAAQSTKDENGKLKRLIADLTLDRSMLQNVLAKIALMPARRRELVRQVEEVARVSERRSCVACRASAGRAFGTTRSHPTGRRYGCAFVISPRYGSATAIPGSAGATNTPSRFPSHKRALRPISLSVASRSCRDMSHA